MQWGFDESKQLSNCDAIKICKVLVVVLARPTICFRVPQVGLTQQQLVVHQCILLFSFVLCGTNLKLRLYNSSTGYCFRYCWRRSYGYGWRIGSETMPVYLAILSIPRCYHAGLAFDKSRAIISFCAHESLSTQNE